MRASVGLGSALRIRREQRRSQTRRPLGPAFWSLCTAGLASSIGDGAVFVGFPILTATLTRDPRLLAGVAVAQRLPWLLLSLITGALADRLDHRRLIGAVELLRMIAVGVLGVAIARHMHPLFAVYIAAFTLGSLETAFTATSGAVVPALVDRQGLGREALGRANGYLYAAQMSGEGVLGPAVGGLLAAAALSLPFLFDSATFAVSGALLLLMLPRRSAAKSEEKQGARSMASEVREGLRWFLADRAVRVIALFVAGMALCQAAVFGVLVLWAQTYLHSSRAGYGLLLTVAAFGVVGAALITGRVMHHFSGARMLLLAGATAATAYVVLSSTQSAFVAALALLFEGAAVSMGNVVSFALRQALIPAGLLGRVGNAMRMCIYGAMPAGAAAGGLLASALGIRTMFAAAGLAQVTAVILVRRPLLDALGSAPGVGVWALAGPAEATEPAAVAATEPPVVVASEPPVVVASEPAVMASEPAVASQPAVVSTGSLFDQDVAQLIGTRPRHHSHLFDQDRPAPFDQDHVNSCERNVTFA